MPLLVLNNRSATIVLLVSDQSPTFCMDHASEAEKLSIVCWGEPRLATAAAALGV